MLIFLQQRDNRSGLKLFEERPPGEQKRQSKMNKAACDRLTCVSSALIEVWKHRSAVQGSGMGLPEICRSVSLVERGGPKLH